jgi:uncharacterized repeat protein (TIGR01451 family)
VFARLARCCALLVLLLAVSATAMAPRASAQDSKGTNFWLAFPENFDVAPPATQTLFISGATDATGTVDIPGIAFSQPFTVTADQVTSVPLPANAQMVGVDSISARGIHVTASAEVTVYGLNRRQSSTDAYLGLPVDAVGTDYIALGYSGLPGQAGGEIAVAATVDDTTVSITPTATVGAHPAGMTYTVALDQGEAYQGRAAGGGDLSGTIITSDKPVSAYGGAQCANVPTGFGFCDHLVEQLTPTTSWGQSFSTVPLASRLNGDTFRILASADNTEVKVNGATVATLNRGQFYERIIAGRSAVTADKPILVMQYSNGSTYDGVISDPFQMMIPPNEQFLARYTITTPASGFNSNFVNVVAPTSAVGSVTLDGTAIPAADFQPIPGTSFSGAQVPIALGAHTLAGTQPFGVTTYGFGTADSYGYPGGLSVSEVATVTKVALAPKTASLATGAQHCVTATVTDQNDAPVEGVRVDFTVTGPNATTGFATTNAQGTAQFCYTGANAGDDTITASVGRLSDTATATFTSKSADVALTKSDSPDPVVVGQTLTYSLTATNNGPDNATGVAITDTLPDSVTFVSATPSQGSCTGEATVTCSLGSIANGANATVEIKVTPNTAKTITNSATATSNEADPNTENNTSTEDTVVQEAPSGADVSVTQTDSSDPVADTDTLTYTLTIANAGPGAATNVTLTDTLPGSVTLISVTPVQGTCTGTTVITCELGTIASGDSTTVQIRVNPDKRETITNVASVTADQQDPDTANNTDSETTEVVSQFYNIPQSGGGGNQPGGNGNGGNNNGGGGNGGGGNGNGNGGNQGAKLQPELLRPAFAKALQLPEATSTTAVASRRGNRIRIRLRGSMINTSGRDCAGQLVIRTRAAGNRKARGRRVAIRARLMKADCTYKTRYAFAVKRLPARLRPRSHRLILTIRTGFAGNDGLFPDGAPRRKVKVNRGG